MLIQSGIGKRTKPNRALVTYKLIESHCRRVVVISSRIQDRYEIKKLVIYNRTILSRSVWFRQALRELLAHLPRWSWWPAPWKQGSLWLSGRRKQAGRLLRLRRWWRTGFGLEAIGQEPATFSFLVNCLLGGIYKRQRKWLIIVVTQSVNVN